MDISSMLQNLSADDMAKLKETASRFFGSADTPDTKNEPSRGGAMPFDLSAIDPEVLKNAAKISSMMSQKDARSDFLMSLKPLLGESRRKKADEAATMLKLLSVLNAMRGNGA